MLGLDTNVLVRFLVRDDEAQFERARKLIVREVRSGGRVLISLLVLLETEWVLRSRYELKKAQILEVFADLLASMEVELEDEHSVESALCLWQAGNADFADCLISARHLALGCRATASFDARASKLPGFIAP